MRRPLLVLAVLAALGLACGSIADPTRVANLGASSQQPDAGPGTRLGRLSGSLAIAPPDAGSVHVALVFRFGAGAAVLGDAPVIDGHYTLDLPEVPETYFAPAETSFLDLTGGYDYQDTGGGASTYTFDPDSDVIEGSVSGPLRAAVAGLVVYADRNGNGKLDIEPSYVSSPDEILGGNDELLIVALRGGGSLDYEKLADHGGVQPHAGFNLAWFERRWLSLKEAELKLAPKTKLPGKVCAFLPGAYGSDGVGIIGQPPPGDPKLHCSVDGFSWKYDHATGEACPPWAIWRTATLPPLWPPPPNGMCLYRYGDNFAQCHNIYEYASDAASYPGVGHRSDWPCPIPSQGFVPPPRPDGGI
jgi:hypothetical protein